MKKIYLIFYLFPISVILLIAYIFFAVANNEIESEKQILKSECLNVSATANYTLRNLENRIKDLIQSNTSRDSLITKLEFLCTSSSNLISNITIIDNHRNVTSIQLQNDLFIKDVYTSQVQDQLAGEESFRYRNDKYELTIPIYTHKNLFYNYLFTIDLEKYFQEIIEPFKTHQRWQWVFSKQRVLAQNMDSTELLQPIHKLESKAILVRKMQFKNYNFKVLHISAPVYFAKTSFYLVFSTNLSHIIQPVLWLGIFSIIIVILVSATVFFYLHKMISEKAYQDHKAARVEINLIKIFDAIPIGVMILTPDKIIRHINQKASDMLFGKNQSNIIGRNVGEMILPKTYGDQKFNAAYDSGHFYYFEKDGTEYTIYKNDIPFLLNTEDLVIEAFIDVTPIERSRKMEAAANHAKSDFLAKMSHEIRTPMNGIVGMADAMLQLELPPDQREYAEIIKKSSDLLLTIINDILDLSKVEAGKMMLEEIPFSINDEIAFIKELFKPLANKNSIQILSTIDPNVPDNVIGDPFRLRQVLSNLMNNAVKFTSEGRILIRVELQEEYSGHLTLLFTIEDTGIGIPKDKLNSVFASYVQATDNISRKYGGTGLGTTISKQLVELMGGEISVESPSSISEKPEFPGTKFSFTIETYSNEKLRKEADFSSIRQLEQIKAIIVSQSINETEPVCLFFEQIGINYGKHLYSAFDSFQNALASSDFHIIVIIDSLEFDGFKISQELHDNQLSSKFLLILISSNDLSGNFIRSRRLGIDYYMIKPYQTSEIFDIIRHSFTSVTLKDKAPLTLNKTQKNISILVAEDNSINQKVAKTMFKNLGYEISLASNGLEAVEFTMKNNYDIIFMDMMMPEKDGVQATMDLRKLGYSGPIIAMTANASKEGKTRAISFGMDDYITKPTKMDEVKKILIKYFSRSV